MFCLHKQGINMQIFRLRCDIRAHMTISICNKYLLTYIIMHICWHAQHFWPDSRLVQSSDILTERMLTSKLPFAMHIISMAVGSLRYCSRQNCLPKIKIKNSQRALLNIFCIGCVMSAFNKFRYWVPHLYYTKSRKNRKFSLRIGRKMGLTPFSGKHVCGVYIWSNFGFYPEIKGPIYTWWIQEPGMLWHWEG